MPVDLIEEIEEETGTGRLVKSLGLWQLTAIGVGGIIGVGIFSLAGVVAHGDEDNPGVGPAVLIAFLIAGLASAAAAVSYAEFAGMIPRAGSAYTYGYVALGEIIGWFIGWDLLLEYIAIVAVVSIGISGYVAATISGRERPPPPGLPSSTRLSMAGVNGSPVRVAQCRVLFGPEHVSDEVGEVLAGTKVGRSSPDQITVYQSVGLAIQDIAAAKLVYDRAVEKQAGTSVGL